MAQNKQKRGQTVTLAGNSVRPIVKREKVLSDFLEARKVSKGGDFTHTSLGNPIGSYYIPTDEYEDLLDAYLDLIEKDCNPSLTEKHKLMSPVLIDLDFRQDIDTRLYTQDYIQQFLNALITITHRYVEQNVILCYVLEKEKPRTSTSAGQFKDGVHIVLPNVITAPVIQYKIRDEIITNHANMMLLKGVTNDVSDIYDKAVIEKNNWFMYGSKKPDEEFSWKVTHYYRFNKLVGEAEELPIPRDRRQLIKDLSIRYGVNEESRYTLLGKETLKERIPNNQPDTVAKKNDDELKILLSLLSESRFSNYNEWIRVGWCLHNIDKTNLYLWDEFSKKSIKYKDGECADLWKHMRNEGLNIGSLHKWAKEDSPERYVEMVLNKKCSDEYVVLEDLTKNSTIYSYEQVKRVFEKTFSKVMVPGFYIQEKDNEWIIREDNKLRKVYKNLYCMNGEKVATFIEDWVRDRTIKTFQKIDFLPPPLYCPPDVLNLWKGFRIDHYECESSEIIEPFLHHVSVLVGHNEKAKEYFLKWLAQIIQEPGKLIGIALIFVSEEGAGKNIFWDSFANIIGEDYYFETADPEKDLFGRFCNGRKHKLLIDIDEANSKDTFANSEVLKNMITSKIYNYEQKGVDPITMTNFARLVFTTNNILCAKITDNSRRYVIFETSNDKIGDSDYFNSFATYMQDPRNQKAIINYLREIDIKRTNWILERPITETYNALKSLCADPILKYMCHVWEKNRTHYEILKIASELHNEYLDFLKDNLKMKEESMRIWNRNMFGRKMNSLCEQNIGIERKINLGYKKLKGYHIIISELRKFLEKKQLLSESVYMFIDDE